MRGDRAFGSVYIHILNRRVLIMLRFRLFWTDWFIMLWARICWTYGGADIQKRSDAGCLVGVRPVAQLVEHRTPNLLPVRARVRDASALDI